MLRTLPSDRNKTFPRNFGFRKTALLFLLLYILVSDQAGLMDRKILLSGRKTPIILKEIKCQKDLIFLNFRNFLNYEASCEAQSRKLRTVESILNFCQC